MLNISIEVFNEKLLPKIDELEEQINDIEMRYRRLQISRELTYSLIEEYSSIQATWNLYQTETNRWVLWESEQLDFGTYSNRTSPQFPALEYLLETGEIMKIKSRIENV